MNPIQKLAKMLTKESKDWEVQIIILLYAGSGKP